MDMTLDQVLVWLSTGGGSVIVVAYVLERLKSFQALSTEVKFWVNLGLVLFLALGSFAVIQYVPKEVINQVAPWFAVTGGVIVTFLTGQAFHRVDPEKKLNALREENKEV